MTSRDAYIALNMIDEIGPVRVRALLDRFQTPEAILTASASALQQVTGVGAQVARNLNQWRDQVDLERQLAWIEETGVQVVTREDPLYPVNLSEIYDPPLVLYARGTLRPQDRYAIAVVGSRRTSLYGQEMSRRLAFQLARVGVTVVSGLARGIDTHAHRGALQAKGRTVAVVACGLDRVYPPENESLADEIVAGGGALVTEFPLGVMPDRQHFPMRNRIISGWSLGTVVVEAALKSGALITAHQASEQGRQVFAVPGRADSNLSRGANRLIKDGAKLTEDAEDILGEFEYLAPEAFAAPREPAATAHLAGDQQRPRLQLSELEEKIFAALGNEEMIIDEIIHESGLTSAVVSSTLLGLEMKRLVKQSPGRVYSRNPVFREL